MEIAAWQCEGPDLAPGATWVFHFYDDGTFKYTSIAGLPVEGTYERDGDGTYNLLVTNVTLSRLEYFLTVDDGKTLTDGETLSGTYQGSLNGEILLSTAVVGERIPVDSDKDLETQEIPSPDVDGSLTGAF